MEQTDTLQRISTSYERILMRVFGRMERTCSPGTNRLRFRWESNIRKLLLNVRIITPTRRTSLSGEDVSSF